MSSVCAAGIMAVSAVGMSGCDVGETVKDATYGFLGVCVVSSLHVLQGWNRLTDALSSENAKQEKALGGCYITSKADSLWTVVDQDENRVTLSYYKNDISLLEERQLSAVLQYSQPIDELLAESEFWLPLPMAEKAKELFNRKEVLTSALDGANGYWFFYERNYVDSDQPSLSAIDLEQYDFAADKFDLAWYDSEEKTLYVYRYLY